MSARAKPSTIVVSTIVGIVFLGLVLAILYPFRQAAPQSLDVWTRAAWMVSHWSDAQAFPPKSNLCAAPFCARLDTRKKYVGGNPGRRSETSLPFCPEHEPGLPRTGTRFDDLVRFIYWVVAILLSWLEGSVALALVCFPITLLDAVVRRKPGESLWSRAFDGALAFGTLVAAIATVTVWFMFAWW